MAKKQHEGPSGLIVVDKPAGITSHDVVSRMRRLAGTRKVGHAGTLDPMATGVLIVGIGKATKLLTWVVGQTKTYTATIRLGASTVTDDVEGEVTQVASAEDVRAVTDAQIAEAVKELTGNILQVPASVSAIKVDGKRSYALVRGGEEVELKARPVTISQFEVHSVERLFARVGEQEADVIDLEVTISCSSGTYIRALARDVGQALGAGGHLTELRRTRIGENAVEDAHTLEELSQLREENLPLPMVSLEEAAAQLFTVRHLTAAEATDISFGRRISPSSVVAVTEGKTPDVQGITALYAPDGSLVALSENSRFKGQDVAAPILVFEAGKTFEENIS